MIAVLSAALSFGTLAFAQQDPYKPNADEKKVSMGDAAGLKTTEGTVKEFEVGKKLVLTTVDNKTMTFKLDQKGATLNIDPSVAVGAQVKVTEQKGSDGMKTLTVEPAAKSSTSAKSEPGSKS
jgi:hypothetical protein